jgi:hypothetical protein
MWVGGDIGTSGIGAAGTWRGRPMDFATTYPRYATWDDIVASTDAVTDFKGYQGRLSYGLPLLPTDRKGEWTDVTSGAHDAVFQGIARLLVANGHGDAAIRMGPEANGYWFPWSVDSKNAAQFKAAYRHIVAVMRPIAPKLTYWLDFNCGTQMTGTTERKAAFSLMWPGDDVVDGIGMDMYNAYKMAASDDASWQRSLAPSYAPGLSDGAAFARSKRIGLAVPEWGLHDVQGPGDSPFFMQKMFEFFTKNKDVLVYENYFNEPEASIANAVYGSTNNPLSSQTYKTLWGKGS